MTTQEILTAARDAKGALALATASQRNSALLGMARRSGGPRRPAGHPGRQRPGPGGRPGAYLGRDAGSSGPE